MYNHWIVLKTWWQTEKLRNFFFCHHVFKKPSAAEIGYMRERVNRYVTLSNLLRHLISRGLLKTSRPKEKWLTSSPFATLFSILFINYTFSYSLIDKRCFQSSLLQICCKSPYYSKVKPFVMGKYLKSSQQDQLIYFFTYKRFLTP